MAQLSRDQLDVIERFLNALFIRMEEGEHDLKDGFEAIKTAMGSFDAGEHLAPRIGVPYLGALPHRGDLQPESEDRATAQTSNRYMRYLRYRYHRLCRGPG